MITTSICGSRGQVGKVSWIQASAAFLISASLSVPALAQQAPEQEVDRADARRASVEDTQRATNLAVSAMNDPSCPAVTFADVLANPDDTALNVCYARAQIAGGEVRGAVATLERVLLIAPEAINVRLLYAIVLFRLDNVDEAEREFLEVQGYDDLPADVRREIDSFLEQIALRRQATRHTASVTFGTYYDSNRNSAPRSEETLVLGARTPVAAEANRENEEIGWLTALSYEFTHDPGFQNQHEYFGGVDLYGEVMAEESQLDVQAITMDLGARLRFQGFTFTPRAFISNMRLDWDKFFQAEGLELRVDHRHFLSGLEEVPPVDLWYSFTAADEDYHNTRNFQTLTLRSGPKFTNEFGAGMLITPEHHLSASWTLEYKSAAPDAANNADARVFSYDYNALELNHTWLLGDGHFLLSHMLLGLRRYNAADTLVVGNTGDIRHENPFRVRMTYGMPFVDLIGNTWLDDSVNVNSGILDFFDGTTISFAGEYFHQRSNITNFEYNSQRAGLTLSRSFNY